jgi:hypothetical protein
MTSGSSCILPKVNRNEIGRRHTMLPASMYQFIHTKSILPVTIKKSVQAPFANLSQLCRPLHVILKGPQFPLFAFF